MRRLNLHRILYVFDLSKQVGGSEIHKLHMARKQHFAGDCETTAGLSRFLKHELLVCVVRVGIHLNGVSVRYVVG